ncbi:CHASE domain-containing protein [Massilia sp. TS11]|uniref:CHASE domain-containing protein n=1 Tax=Massilia sp. TS11 TaxID=2908003 RepID=UPI001ED9ECF2|nr:CHASE domain-containing protein [Massilia sp. TS11]MCG2583689.1 CHASE domain-containing protein [Massilia sp. TS11]
MASLRTRGMLALFLGWLLTALAALLVLDSQDSNIRAAFQRDSDKLAADTQARLQTYFDSLLSLKGLFASNENTSRVQFARFVRELQLESRYPGFQAIQFVRVVPHDHLAAYADSVRRDTSLEPAGYPRFAIHPEQVNDEHFVIEYTEPLLGNESALGLDLGALAPHRRAVLLARDSGQVVSTERITLVQDAVPQSGFVARAAVYRKGLPLATVAQRRAAFVGLVAIVFRVRTLMSEVIAPGADRHLALRIHDAGNVSDGARASATASNLMYEAGAGGRALPGLTREVRIAVAQRQWVLRFEAQAGSRYEREYVGVVLVSVSGVVISALIAALMMSAGRNRGLAARLRATLDEQRAIQDAASIGIVLVEHGRIVRCTRGLEDILGFSEGDLIGRPANSLLARLGATLASGSGRWEGELELLRKDGRSVWCLVAGKPIRGRQLEEASVWVVQDISARKQAEAALRQAQNNLLQAEKMASLGALVAGVAHELNTPIGNSLLTASALADRFHEFEQLVEGPGITRSALMKMVQDTRQGCLIVVGSLRRAADLINSFKQVAVDQTNDVRRSFNLAEVLHDTLATHHVQLRRAGIRTLLEVPPALAMDSYPGSVGQVISNLINNALLHGFEGRGQGTIRISARELGEQELLLEFADDGVGMSPKTLSQIFDPFFTTKMGRGGSGLGMNIVYNIVTGILGGRVEVDSSPGQGTRVKLQLPRSAPQHEAEAVRSEDQA